MFAVPARASSMAPGERRRSYRYPITAMAQLRLVRSEQRTGAVIHNISSRGVFFSTQIILAEGELVELSMDWPVRLDDRIPLALVVSGTVRRSNLTGAAVRISRYEWRLAVGRWARAEMPVSASL